MEDLMCGHCRQGLIAEEVIVAWVGDDFVIGCSPGHARQAANVVVQARLRVERRAAEMAEERIHRHRPSSAYRGSSPVDLTKLFKGDTS